MSFTLTESKTETGCKLSVKAWNKGQQQVAISRDSQVRVANLTWKKLGQSIRINAGQTKTWTYDLLFSCGTTREYRFLVKQFDANDNLLNQYWYAPAAGSGSSLGLGDLNRFF